MNNNLNVVIIGGGIAGITCLETLVEEFDECPGILHSITLITATKSVKRVVNHSRWGRCSERFEVSGCDVNNFESLLSSRNLELNFVVGLAEHINTEDKTVKFLTHANETSERNVPYDLLCLCNGASPNKLEPINGVSKDASEHILTLRDTASIEELRNKLSKCERLAVVGNGGIGLELAYKVTKCDIVWIVRDEYLGRPFLDSAACRFLMDSLRDNEESMTIDESEKTHESDMDITTPIAGPALGPYWLHEPLTGNKTKRRLEVLYSSEITKITKREGEKYSLVLETDNIKQIYCDIVVSAIGVKPNRIKFVGSTPETSILDGGILIDNQMRTTIRDIYAAGDVVSCENWSENELWFQMRLWTQARQMGYYSAKCIVAHLREDNPLIFSSFDCFSHTTTFFGQRLILLGRFNGQKLSASEHLEILMRTNPGHDYIKIFLKENKVIGATLIGDTDLAETIENLIYDQIDIGSIKHELLDGTVDIEDYFD